MTNSAQFDRNTLAAVKPGVDGALAEINAQMKLYLDAPADNAAALAVMRSELHRLLGVLKMVGLIGAATFCSEIELTLADLATDPKLVSAMHRDILRRAAFAVTHFLDTLANGADNAALRLFPLYQELQQLRGSEMSFELDLFYPNLDVELPKPLLSSPAPVDAMAQLKVLRTHFQQGLLKWMRQDDVAGSVELMQKAVEGAMRCVPQDNRRAFWWVSLGLLECLKLDDVAAEMNVRKLLSSIDKQLRAVAEGQAGDTAPVLNEMLYLVGHSSAKSELLAEIKQIYSLEKYLPELSALSPAEVDQLLATMRDQLRVAEESWELSVQGDKSACEKFIKYVEQIAEMGNKLDRDVLQYLTQQIQALSQYASSPEHAKPIAMDMAMALLLLGSGIDNYRRIGSGFQEQARILTERMQAAVKQQPEDTKRLEELVDLHYQMEQRGDVMAPLANEMLVNLQHVEQGLNAFFNGVIKRSELTELLRLLSQIQGGLRISSLQHAEKLLSSIQDRVLRFSQRDDALRPAERYALADAMSALENYMQYLTHGQAGDVSRLQSALIEMIKLDQAPEPVAAAPVEPVKVATPKAIAPVEPVKIPAPRAIAPIELAEISKPVAAEKFDQTLVLAPVAATPSVEPAPISKPAFDQTLVLNTTTSAPIELEPVSKPDFDQTLVLKASVPIESPQIPPAAAKVPLELNFEPVNLNFEPVNIAAPQPPAAEKNVPPAPAKAPAAKSHRSEEDQELLDIFLEEAQEVLDTLRSNLKTCQLHPDNHESLTTIRRAFHTLKGSGRMVGLNDLGEVAWSVERALNKWLQDNKSASPALLNFIQAAVPLFADWIKMLADQDEITIDSGDLVAAAQQIENGFEPEMGVTAAPELPALSADLVQVSASVPEPAEPSVAEKSVETGDATLSSSSALFNIASAEVKQNIAVLHHQLDELRTAVPPVVQYDFMRAAHTLAGVSRTMGFDSVVELAYALEGWLQARLEQVFTLNGDQLLMLDQSVAALDEMIQRICDKESPHTRSDLVGQLLADKDNLGEVVPELANKKPVIEERVTEPAKDLMPEISFLQELRVETTHPQDGAIEPMPATDLSGEFAVAPGSAAEIELQPFDLDIFKLATDALPEADQSQIETSKIEIQTESQSPEPQALGWPVAATENLLQPFELDLAKPQAEPLAKVDQPQLETEEISSPPGKGDLGWPVAGSTPPPENILQPVELTVAKPTAEFAETDKPRVYDDIDDQLLPVFLEEVEELCPQISEALRSWREPPHDEAQVPLLNRLLHTMKGSSRMVGAMRIGEIAHEMEDRVQAADQLRDQAGYWDALEGDFDHIMALLEELRGGKPAPEVKPVVPVGRRAEDQPVGVERRADRRSQEPGAERGALGNMLRVRADVIDRLVNEAGEISVARSRMETELRVFKEGLHELTASVIRLRQQLREVEIQAESQMQARVTLAKDHAEQFDPLEFDRFSRLQELTRFMNESVHDVQTVQQLMLKNLDDTATVMLAQGRLNRELQQGLMNVRMVSFNSIADRLYRIVRQTGKELNKRANLELQGTNVELDRSVLEKMVAPFEHLLRNSIVHGLEDYQLRAQSGKHPIGEIRIAVRQESNEVVFEFSDDGAGLNFERLREKAIQNGTLQADEEASDDQLAQLIFMPGLSTATEITEVAGRGIGMDVVRSEIASLGGRIDVSSKRGEGTQFLIHLPLTLAVTQVLMVRAGEAVYAIPATMVEQVRQAKAAEMDALYVARQIEWQGNSYPLHYLPHLVGNMEIVQESQPRNHILLLRSGAQRIALHVDEMLGNQEAMVKNIGPQLARLSGIAGATVTGDGRVVLILNPPQMAQRIGVSTTKVKKEVAKPHYTEPLIMVVDDSLTVRKITTRMLTRAGYQVVTATDGVDALEKLKEYKPDVMLLDIEMPRMDGFALAKELRRDPETQHMPIIMITSRTADKHRDYAMQLGVNTYLGKPYQEDELLQNIADFVAVHKLDA